MIDIGDITSIHLEISSRCNSVCPGCPRNFYGVECVDDYPLCDMRLEQVQRIFAPEFLAQLNYFLINGNYGDFVTARDGLAIVQYLRQHNDTMQIRISTNASAQPRIWADLAIMRPVVEFRIDGLSDTHNLYRQKTDWHMIIDNAKKFIAAGGHAIWAMILFDHNRHQIDDCRQMSLDLGFREFVTVQSGRDTMPVFAENKKISHIIGDYQKTKEFDVLWNWHRDTDSRWQRAKEMVKQNITEIQCPAKQGLNIYVAANGEVFPCCWTGFYPQTSQSQVGNHQIKSLIRNNNALEHGLEAAVAWFAGIEQSWTQPDIDSGRLYVCHQTCGVSDV